VEYPSRVIFQSDLTMVPWSEKVFSAAVGKGEEVIEAEGKNIKCQSSKSGIPLLFCLASVEVYDHSPRCFEMIISFLPWPIFPAIVLEQPHAIARIDDFTDGGDLQPRFPEEGQKLFSLFPRCGKQ